MSSPDPKLTALVERVRKFARAEALWPTGAHLLVAVSGGADSVVLLDMLQCFFAPVERLRLTVAHVHHGLRAEAEEEVSFVTELAGRAGLPLLLRRVSVPARVAESGESVEEAARNLRYAALREMAGEAGATHIATGHTADDQAETVLMRLLRGAGLAGLAGIPPQRDCIVRPLLPLWRADIIAYARRAELEFCTDQTNFSPDFARNRLRLELLPQLEEQYAPRLRHRLAHLAELARQDNTALDEMASDLYVFARERVPGGIALPWEPSQLEALRCRCWRQAIREVRGSLEDISYEHLQAIRNLPPGGHVQLPGVLVAREANQLVLLPGEHEPAYEITETPLLIPGRQFEVESGCFLTTDIFDTAIAVEGGDVAVMNGEALHPPFTVRGWHPGDRFTPLGAPGARKLQDIFVDAGVPRRLRTRIPLVCDRDGIVWVAGYRIADRVKILRCSTSSVRILVEWEVNPWS